MAVIDASVYVALVNANEPGHAQSWVWFREAITAQEGIIAPVILLPEVAAALSRGVGDPDLAQRTVRQLRNSKAIALQPVTPEIAAQAADIAARHRIRGCDAVYVALAAHTGETLVTLDRQQLTHGKGVVQTREP